MSLDPIEKREKKSYASLTLYFLIGVVVLLVPTLLLLVRLHEGAAPTLTLTEEAKALRR